MPVAERGQDKEKAGAEIRVFTDGRINSLMEDWTDTSVKNFSTTTTTTTYLELEEVVEAALPALGMGTKEPEPAEAPGGPGPGGTDDVPKCEGCDNIDNGS